MGFRTPDSKSHALSSTQVERADQPNYQPHPHKTFIPTKHEELYPMQQDINPALIDVVNRTQLYFWKYLI